MAVITVSLDVMTVSGRCSLEAEDDSGGAGGGIATDGLS